jgi:hypothetical protein
MGSLSGGSNCFRDVVFHPSERSHQSFGNEERLPNPEKTGFNAREDKTVEDECVDVLAVLHLLESWEDLAVVKIDEQ